MRRQVGLGIRALVCGVVLVAAVYSPALAADPNAAGSGATTSGTGISIAGADNSSVTPAMMKQKEAQFQAYIKSGILPPRYVKTGAAAKSASAMAANIAVSPMYATSTNLTWYPGFHQKTTYYCLVAVVQSMAFFDIEGEWYYDLGSGSIAGAQNKIYNGYYDPNGTHEPGIISSLPPGADDSKAVVWLNNQYKSHALTWFYLAVTPTSLTDLMNKIHFDVANYYDPTYIRVDLSVAAGTGYMWHQNVDAKGRHPEHATLAVGYNDSAGTIWSYDPFSVPSGSTCAPTTSSTPDWGCNWTISQTRYYKGMDRTITNPIWY